MSPSGKLGQNVICNPSLGTTLLGSTQISPPSSPICRSPCLHAVPSAPYLAGSPASLCSLCSSLWLSRLTTCPNRSLRWNALLPTIPGRWLLTPGAVGLDGSSVLPQPPWASLSLFWKDLPISPTSL